MFLFWFSRPQVAHDEQPQQDGGVFEVGDVGGGVAFQKNLLLGFAGLLQVQAGWIQKLHEHTHTNTSGPLQEGKMFPN